jgi:glutamate synthase (NADPH/NADH) small chain
MHLGIADATGRQTPQPLADSTFDLEADLVISALGFDPEDMRVMFDMPELELSRHGTVKTALDTLMTSLDGVFAAGDIARGASLVVWAIRDGRDAAAAIHRYLLNRDRAVAGAAAAAAD